MFLAAFTSALQAYPQAVHANRAWLSREFASTCPHAEQRWLVYAGLIFCTRAGALSCSRRTSRPQHDRMISRFSPALARTFRPGFAVVPRAERVMVAIFRSSTRIRSNRRAMPVLAFSAQSLRRSLSRALSRAMACLTWPRRFDPRWARASLRCRRRTRRRCGPVRPGACRSSPVDRAADTVTPRSMPTTWPLPGAGIGSGITAKAMCQRPARSIVTR